MCVLACTPPTSPHKAVYKLLNLCYAAFSGPLSNSDADNVCSGLAGGHLAKYENYETAKIVDWANDPNYYSDVTDGSKCQWIGLTKKLWTWPALGTVRGVYPYLPMATNAPWSFFFLGGGNQLKV